MLFNQYTSLHSRDRIARIHAHMHIYIYVYALKQLDFIATSYYILIIRRNTLLLNIYILYDFVILYINSRVWEECLGRVSGALCTRTSQTLLPDTFKQKK